MILGFQEYTHALTDEELVMATMVAKKISKNIGSDMAVKNDRIAAYLKSNGHKAGAARIRKIIHHIRATGMVQNLIASSKGYYVENNPERLRKYIYSLKQRAHAIMHIARALEIQTINTNANE